MHTFISYGTGVITSGHVLVTLAISVCGVAASKFRR